ncbi:NPC1-like intracellular cholesterol transporter 1 [Pseudonaja textilis]|uniref:NPC1-like intracellular cholesterol transporter 1 n=1 Tax=Pseudonaja textilis TaxID=8673 RepID=UPI000EA859A3|nr:NPC1-like intracellular cholesterol transporter 1 [Pseudonaja textilis]
MLRVALFAVVVLSTSLDLRTEAAALTEIHRAGYCAAYGECGLNPELGTGQLPHKVPCLSNTPARLLTGSHLSHLKKLCPMLFTGENSTYACCSLGQLQFLEQSLMPLWSMLSRCPACTENFSNIHCQNICSPNQSQFINITRDFTRDFNGTFMNVSVRGVLEFQSFYSQQFAEEVFRSCKGVRIPATGGYVMDVMCGKYGKAACNAQRWLDFQGDTSNGLAPLAISFQLKPGDWAAEETGILPLNKTVWKCSEAVHSSPKCSCPDCEQSCPAIQLPSSEYQPFKVGSMDGVLFASILLFGVVALSFMSLLLWQRRSSPEKQKGRSKEDAVTKSATSEKVSQAVYDFFVKAFSSWGTLVASNPIKVVLLSLAIVAGLSSGMMWMELTTDPLELWASPDSQARQEKALYEEHFGPFFRTNQIILTAKNPSSYIYDSIFWGRQNFSGVFSQAVLLDLLDLQTRLQGLKIWSEKHQRQVTLQDICYAPLNPRNASLSDCAVNSLLQFFQNNRTLLHRTANQTVGKKNGTVDWRDHFLYCIHSPASFQDTTELKLSCMSDYGAPVFPFLAVGGYSGLAYSEAEALILTFSLNNFLSGDPHADFVLLWEERFLEVVQEFQKNNSEKYAIAYMAERSLEDEVSRSTWEDLPIFAVSYLVIFIYITVALGEYSSCRNILVDAKLSLALGGILVVLGAVLSSLGFYSFVGLPSSLIIIEVVPFLVLAVGADNIFIFVLGHQKSQPEPGETPEQHLGRTLGSVAPSMLLCSLSEVICFFLGALTPMPAVQTFALSAALAVFFVFLLQMSLFVALMSLDIRRQKASRVDLCCCLRVPECEPVKPHDGLLRTFMRKIYTPALLGSSIVRALVVLLFVLLFCAGIYLTFHIDVGLEQELAVPKDSYMVTFFQFFNRYFMVGAPMFFVTTGGYNYNSVPGMNSICSSSGCNNNSMTQTIQMATKFPEKYYLAIPATSWVDDFIDWLNPISRCCRIYKSGPNKDKFCPSTSDSLACTFNKCMGRVQGILRPNREEFNKFLPWFLQDMPNFKCPKGGLGAYDTSVRLGSDGEILASRFMAYHTPLKNSQENTAALKVMRQLAANITATLREVPGTDPNFQVFPYAITYVFYEQYLTITTVGLINLALCLVPTFAVCYILLGLDLRSAFINLLTIIMIIVDTVGAMNLWGISYNAVSLINLVTAVGISVEFVSHITLSFAMSKQPTKVERSREATINMGSAVFAGVAMTNLPGIVVLAFAKAQVIQVFFFRLNLIITLLGMLHGLVFLPVILSYFGPSVRQGTPELQPRTETPSVPLEGKGAPSKDQTSPNNHSQDPAPSPEPNKTGL